MDGVSEHGLGLVHNGEVALVKNEERIEIELRQIQSLRLIQHQGQLGSR